jgi:hypothetical protein
MIEDPGAEIAGQLGCSSWYQISSSAVRRLASARRIRHDAGPKVDALFNQRPGRPKRSFPAAESS